MKNVLLAAALAAGLVGAGALPALAGQIKVVETNPTTGQLTLAGSNVNDMFTFVATGNVFRGSLTEELDNFTLTGGSLSGPAGLLFASQASSDIFGDSTFGFRATGLIKGDTYTLTVNTTGVGSFGGTVSGATVPSTVPLPASVAMFGAALAGLGVVGFARKQSKAASGAVA